MKKLMALSFVLMAAVSFGARPVHVEKAASGVFSMAAVRTNLNNVIDLALTNELDVAENAASIVIVSNNAETANAAISSLEDSTVQIGANPEFTVMATNDSAQVVGVLSMDDDLNFFGSLDSSLPVTLRGSAVNLEGPVLTADLEVTANLLLGNDYVKNDYYNSETYLTKAIYYSFLEGAYPLIVSIPAISNLAYSAVQETDGVATDLTVRDSLTLGKDDGMGGITDYTILGWEQAVFMQPVTFSEPVEIYDDVDITGTATAPIFAFGNGAFITTTNIGGSVVFAFDDGE